MHNKKGQASILLIILSAVAIILFAITLNWGRISQYKNVTTVAATVSAAQVASNYASYSEMLFQTQLGGSLQKCKHNSIFGALLTFILVIVIVGLTGNGTFLQALGTALSGGGGIMASAALAMSAASLVLQVAVVQPGLTRYWNQLQQDAGLSSIETFLSNGLQAALQNVVTDNAQITDYFDSNMNGRFGFNAITGRPEDTISRFAFYNGEYLRNLKSTRNSINIKNFTDGLSVFLSQISIPGINKADPRYNPCCVPLEIEETSIRPSFETCPDQNIIPLECNGAVWSGAPNFYGNTYPFAYEPGRPDYTQSNSFLTKLGIDEEVRVFSREKVKESTGLFRAFWDMGIIRDDTSLIGVPGVLAGIKMTDNVVVVNEDKFFAPDNVCASDLKPEDGINWKPGKDTYCERMYPYGNCAKYDCPGVETGENCCTAAGAMAGLWPEDMLDQTIDELKTFYSWGSGVLAADQTKLASQVDAWYDNSGVAGALSGRDWLGPVCDGSNGIVCAKDGGYDDGKEGGVIYTIRRRLVALDSFLVPWLNKKFSDNQAWCVPPNSAGLSTVEKTTIQGTHEWGTLPTVLNCLKWYSDPDSDLGAHFYFKRCQDRIENMKDRSIAVRKFEVCKVDYDKARQAETFVTCKNSINSWMATAKASAVAAAAAATEYNKCKTTINDLKISDPQYCVLNPIVPPAECWNFSLTAPNPAQPAIYDACKAGSGYLAWIDANIAYFNGINDAYCNPPIKPEPNCTTSLMSRVGEPGFDVCTGSNYFDWLDAQVVKYGGNTISKICTDGLFETCQNLPASTIVPVPNPCTQPTAASQWAEDSKRSYENDLTFDQHCAPPQQIPKECISTEWFPRSAKGAVPLYDVCDAGIDAKGTFQTWLDDSMDAMATPGVIYKDRYDFLKSLVGRVQTASDATKDFIFQLNTFLAKPVKALLTARASINGDTIPNHVIYGWQDAEPPPNGKNFGVGYWHVVQVKAKVPGKLASIGTKRKGFLGSTRCYFLRDYSGNVRFEVTRWDEDHDQAKFSNKIPIWKVSYRKPGTADVQNPSALCIGNAWKKVGISKNPDTFAQLSAVWNKETVNLTHDLLKGAFMMNGEPAADDPGKQCYDFVSATILPSGIKTTVCAVYTTDSKTRGFGVHFEKCN